MIESSQQTISLLRRMSSTKLPEDDLFSYRYKLERRLTQTTKERLLIQKQGPNELYLLWR